MRDRAIACAKCGRAWDAEIHDPLTMRLGAHEFVASDAPAPPREEPELIRANMSIETPDAAPREEPLFTDEQVAALKAAAFAAHSADGGSEDVFRAFCGCGFRSFGSPGLPLCSLLRAVRFARSAFAASPAQEATPPREWLAGCEWPTGVQQSTTTFRAAPTPEASAPEPEDAALDGLAVLRDALEDEGQESRALVVQEAEAAILSLRATVAALTAERDALRSALSGMVEMYVAGVDSGDWGNWNPEDEDEVRAARAALAARAAPRGDAAP